MASPYSRQRQEPQDMIHNTNSLSESVELRCYLRLFLRIVLIFELCYSDTVMIANTLSICYGGKCNAYQWLEKGF
jgi:hypothetical protein